MEYQEVCDRAREILASRGRVNFLPVCSGEFDRHYAARKLDMAKFEGVVLTRSNGTGANRVNSVGLFRYEKNANLRTTPELRMDVPSITLEELGYCTDERGSHTTVFLEVGEHGMDVYVARKNPQQRRRRNRGG